jgi:DNA (cytosine-5)-methyltransferase 1
MLNSIEIFSGAGGLALGVSNAGFKHAAVIERDKYACNSLRLNHDRGMYPVVEWPVHQIDVRNFDFSFYADKIDLLAGGPPCQPFSLGGKHKAFDDQRDMFPTTAEILRTVRPKAFILENVKGLLRESFITYFEYILLSLSYSSHRRKKYESWIEHLSRLEQMQTRGTPKDYNILFNLLNAADYGVAQKRERVFMVGFRTDLEVSWSFNKDIAPTHSQDALLWDKWVSQEYWERHEVAKQKRPKLSSELAHKINKLKTSDKPKLKPWLTVRDAISDLPDPEKKPNAAANHIFNPGAKTYPGHTGSNIDESAKTLKAGDHGVPGGENMVAFSNGDVRYFTVRESARLQGFPDEYLFSGTWTESMRQLGNAVPVPLGQAVANSIKKYLTA